MRGPPFQIAAACRHRLSGLNRVVGGEAQISLKVMPLGRSYEAPAPKFGRGRGPSRRADRERVRASVELCVAPWPGLSLLMSASTSVQPCLGAALGGLVDRLGVPVLKLDAANFLL